MSILEELKELDNKYKMEVSFLGNGNIDAFFIFKKMKHYLEVLRA